MHRSSRGPAVDDPGRGALSDQELIRSVADVLAVPRAKPADSFVLHAPLELLARAALLPLVDDRDRGAARAHLGAIADRFEASGPGIEPVRPPRADRFDSADAATAYLAAAVRAGDLDGVDQAGWWLAAMAKPAGLRRRLAAPVLASLAAAGHAPIFLHLHPRVAAASGVSALPVRGLLRELARRPTWRLRWIDEAPYGSSDAGALEQVLSDTVDLGRGGSDFIQPTMDRVDATGIAAERLGPVIGSPTTRHARVLARVAARSMLLDRPAAAPYGWTHCLTMPQALMSLTDVVDPGRALRVAATEVLGFRASLGDRTVPRGALGVDGDGVPADPGIPVNEALRVGPSVAAGAVWHSPDPDGSLRASLASAASRGQDAHLVKYTLACLDAAASDPSHRRLHLAAAAYLVGWWARQDGQDVAT